MNKKIIWKGIYKKLPKNSSNYFNDKNWHKKSIKKIKLKKKISTKIINNFIAFVILNLKKLKPTILDYGGGYGDLFFEINNKIKKNFKITVYDNNLRTIQNAKKVNKKYRNKLTYENNIKKINGKKFDIIYFGSVVQYIFDLNYIIKTVKKINPTYLIFYDLMAGNNQEFYSQQIFYGKKMNIKFYNLDLFKKSFKSIDYSPVYESEMLTTVHPV